MRNITEMGSLGSAVFLLVMLVQLQLVIGKPFFTELLCDFLCDDDDDVTTTTAANNNDDDYDFFGLCSCGTRRPPTALPIPGIPNMPSNINIRLPPSPNEISFSYSNTNGLPSINFDAGRPAGAPAGAPTAPPAAGPGPGPTTVPPPGGAATTAAATTAAATTAKK